MATQKMDRRAALGTLGTSGYSLLAPRTISPSRATDALDIGAPYTKAHSGVAIRLADGSVHSGAYIENAAFNPSLPPLQAALISVLNARKAPEKIEEAVLVELDGAAISQYSLFEATVRSVSPQGRVRKAVARRVSQTWPAGAHARRLVGTRKP